jgi:hypothetical protein
LLASFYRSGVQLDANLTSLPTMALHPISVVVMMKRPTVMMKECRGVERNLGFYLSRQAKRVNACADGRRDFFFIGKNEVGLKFLDQRSERAATSLFSEVADSDDTRTSSSRSGHF